MTWKLMTIAGLALSAGFAMLARVGDALWASQVNRSHSPMIFLFLLLVLFPMVSMLQANTRRRRR